MQDDSNNMGTGNQPTVDRSIRRRPFLGALGGLGLAAGVAGRVGAQDDESELEWESAADQRIEEHRMDDLEVLVEDEDGEPIADADVQIEMQDHDFGFGTAVHAEFLTRGTEWGSEIYTEEDQQKYVEAVEEHFNTIVLENLHKWYMWEDNTEIADEAVDWALERDMDVRGHVGLWGNVGAWAIPPRVVEAMGDPWASDWGEAGEPDYDPDYVVEESMNHLAEIIDYYGDDIKEWEVKNEVLHETAMIEAVEGDGGEDESIDPVTAPILGDWYEHAEEVASQHDVGIAVNDYNTLVGPYEETRDDYERQVDYLVNDRGIELDGIGFQSHFGYQERLTSEEVMAGLDRFADYSDGLRSTEFDMFQGDWSEEEQADFMHMFLKTFFSHPDTEDFLMWGIWDPLHWGDELGEDKDAPLYDDEWNEKPSYEAYVDLVFDEWWTEESTSTDDDGSAVISGFLGEYEVTVTADGLETTETVALSDGGQSVEISLTEDDAAENGDDDQDEDSDQSEDDNQSEDDQNDSETEDGDDSVPGFGVVTGLAGLGATASYLRSRSDDE